ncbi:hypothetical protein AU874_22405 [Salmonella enterica subsp. enterica serovar Paratyphi B str. SPB7]|uniref:Uncharacterized protein n=1 Tax=Salmonella enterica TaxID=28901 RepID=A0A744VKS9_SALER|nr:MULTISPECIES: hypothetical protein [Enterobacteriaceae]EBH8147890.1 hypothetical protein [Salmonella enterica subsp. enterica serovar Paratyphi B str. SPB7]EBP4101529.1 hypothetical protein [Salmonella enterica subsp. enterica]ECN0435667.1 hypothetical protein [Salmonella enterica subsp. enterica serovar Enteritidis]EEM1700919.1 hypothetical protein [Salmonella enterica]EHU0008718.1 hypothetical protein [Salmonella enterica subsp. enterica serovar Braenderup]HBA1025520.1 hypothetical prote
MNMKNDFFNIDTDIKKPKVKKHKQIEEMDFALKNAKGEFFKEQRSEDVYPFDLQVSKNGEGNIYSSGVINNNTDEEKNTHITNIRIPLPLCEELKKVSTSSMTKDAIVLIQWSIREIKKQKIDIMGRFNDKKAYRGNEVIDAVPVQISVKPGEGLVFSLGVITKDTKTEKLNHYTNLRFPLETWNELKSVCTTNITKDIVSLLAWGIKELKSKKIDLIAQFNDKKTWKND